MTSRIMESQRIRRVEDRKDVERLLMVLGSLVDEQKGQQGWGTSVLVKMWDVDHFGSSLEDVNLA